VFIKNLPVILKLLAPYLFGIIFQFYIKVLFPYLEISILLLFVLVLLNLPVIAKQHFLIKTNGVLISLFFWGLGCFSVTSTDSLKNTNYFFKQGQNSYQLYVNEPVVEKDKSVKVFVDVISKNKCKSIGKSLVYLEKSPLSLDLKYGDIILVNGSFTSIKTNGNPEEFNYRDYLQKKQIYHQIYLKNNQWKKVKNKANLIFKFTYSIRNYYSHLIDDSFLEKHNKDVLKALLLGQKDDLDRDTLRTFSSAGAMHVLAVSGLHVGIIMLMLMFVFKSFKRIKYGKKIYVLLIVLCLWFYAFLTGLSPSVLRSALMFSFVVIGKEMERETSIYQSILVSAFILIIINPLVIFKVGFQLSYLAVLGIIYLQPKIYNLWYIKYKILDYLWKITTVSIAAQIATFPLGLYYFHQFPNYFFISNLIVIPLAGGMLGLGLGYLFLFKIPFVNDFILLLLDYFLSFLNYFVEKVEQLPYSILWGISITWYETIFIYIILLFIVFAFTLKRIKLLLTALFFNICLIGIFMINSFHYQQQNQLVVYNVKNEVALDVFYGKNNFFIASDSLYNDNERMLFNIKHNWFKIRQNENPYQFISTNVLKKPIFKINKTTLSIIEDDTNKYITDFVIIGKVNIIEKSYLSALEKNQTTVIISSKCTYKVKMFIEKNYPKNLIHKLDEKGAFIFSF
jgi:competence protein ComEC